MNEPARTTSQAAGQSVADLVKDVTELVPQLVRDEIKLAQLELARKGKQAGLGAGMLSGGGLIALYGIGCLIAAVIIAISGAIAAWLAALIVGAALLAAAGVAALAGASRLRRATPPVPQQAMDSVQADIREIKAELHDKGAHQPAVQQTTRQPGTGR